MTEWGETIEAGSVGYPTKGERPAWLVDADTISFRYYAGGSFSMAKTWTASNITWNDKQEFRLPATHWAYQAINAGFTPWAGGPTAPDDWDGGDVLWDAGEIGGQNWSMERDSACWQRDELSPGVYYLARANLSIIGYNRRPAPTAPSDLDRACRLLDALTDRMGAPRVGPLDTLSGVLTQIDNATTGLAVRDDVIVECLAEAEASRGGKLYDAVQISAWRDAIDPIRALLPPPAPDPIETLVDEYWNSDTAVPMGRTPTRREEIANVIRWLKEREG